MQPNPVLRLLWVSPSAKAALAPSGAGGRAPDFGGWEAGFPCAVRIPVWAWARPLLREPTSPMNLGGRSLRGAGLALQVSARSLALDVWP